MMDYCMRILWILSSLALLIGGSVIDAPSDSDEDEDVENSTKDESVAEKSSSDAGCPPPKLQCLIYDPTKDLCSKHDDCPTGKLCCFGGCNKGCLDKSKVCPPAKALCFEYNPKYDLCKNDYDCAENELCCFDTCNKGCLVAL